LKYQFLLSTALPRTLWPVVLNLQVIGNLFRIISIRDRKSLKSISEKEGPAQRKVKSPEFLEIAKYIDVSNAYGI
jgi:hypothetical protein